MGSDFKYYIEIMLQWVSTLHPKIQPRIDQIGAELELSETLKLNFHEFFLRENKTEKTSSLKARSIC